MKEFGDNLRRRAGELGLSNAEVARRVGLNERRYAFYVTGEREPDLATLLRIAQVLGCSVDELMGSVEDDGTTSQRDALLAKLHSAAQAMSHDDLEFFVAQAGAIVKLRTK